jgi:hypothetical protein
MQTCLQIRGSGEQQHYFDERLTEGKGGGLKEINRIGDQGGGRHLRKQPAIGNVLLRT